MEGPSTLGRVLRAVGGGEALADVRTQRRGQEREPEGHGLVGGGADDPGAAAAEAQRPQARAQVSGGKFWTVPVLSSGRLFLRNSEGLVTCLDLSAARDVSAR